MRPARNLRLSLHGPASRSAARRAVSSRPSDCYGRAPASERGIALIAVLWLTVLLTVIASGFAFSMHGEATAARNAISLAQARAAADGAVERTAFELSRPRNLADGWNADGTPQTWTEDGIKLTTWAVDESARIDLNTASDPLLKGLLQNVGGLDPMAAGNVLDAILDWRDADDLKRPNGAEEADYRAAGRSYKPANAPFDSVGELARVLGVTPGLVARLADSLTIYSRQPGVNPATATRDVLLAIPNMTPEVVDAFIAQRKEALAAKLPVPGLPQAQGLATGAVQVWRIRAEAAMPDGVTFVRDAVLRPSADPRRPVIALLWQEGARTPPPPASDAEARTATENSNGQTFR
jgi:general secretion pathway protein K